MELQKKRCASCGKIFNAIGKTIYCSDQCKKNGATRKVKGPRRCVVCGNLFEPKTLQTIACSAECKRLRRIEQTKEAYRRERDRALPKPKKKKTAARTTPKISIDEMESKAREMSMSYGQYQAYLYAKKGTYA